MVFSSLLFLFVFLPIICILYFVMPKQFKNIVLLIASLFFYAWGEPVYILLMLFSIVMNWIWGMLLDWKKRARRWILVMAILSNIVILGWYKYLNFAVEIINQCFSVELPIREVSLPIGISFFTFQILSYLIDLYRGEYKVQRNIVNLALYISFFPQLIAGPIVRFKEIVDQLQNRSATPDCIMEGIRRFIYGLGKKVIIANSMAQCVDRIYALDLGELTGLLAWLASIMYTLQIYYDFSGYSDMAIGLGRMFGFAFPENFHYPYLASSVQEFWRRWHITLSAWFREYLYIPMGGNRKGRIRTYVNLLILFLATGLWHGANYTFLLWGLYYGVLSVIERAGVNRVLQKHSLLKHVYTVLIVNFGWVLFRSDSLVQAGEFLKRMLLPWKYMESIVPWQAYISHKALVLMFFGIAGCGVVQQLCLKCDIGGKSRYMWKNSYPELICCTFILIFSISMLAGNTYNPFIYFRF